MNVVNAKRVFKKMLDGWGKSLESLEPHEGIDAMLRFYRETRADSCDIRTDGDMLLFEWATYMKRASEADDENEDEVGEEARDGEERFTVGITRQLMSEEAQGEIWQLSVTFEFEPEFEDVGSGNDWCYNTSEIDDFEADIASSDVLEAIRGQKPLIVRLTYENVE